MIGYWAYSLGRAPSSGMHYEAGGRPMCKYRPAASMVFQVCAAASCTDLLTCRDCKKRAALLNQKYPRSRHRARRHLAPREETFESRGDRLVVIDAGDLKHVLTVVGANADHSARLASWLAEQLNEGGQHGRASEVPLRVHRKGGVPERVQERQD
jgi:hypothetical protein